MTHHEAVLECTDWQPVDGLVDAAKDGSALAPKALCVDDTGFPLFWHHIKTAEHLWRKAYWQIRLKLCLWLKHTFCVCVCVRVQRFVADPNPKSSMFGGRVDCVHVMNLSGGQCSSSPSSSQSWSPLHTRDWLMHFPEDRHIHKPFWPQLCSVT